MFEQEFTGLEAFWELLADGLLDDAGTCESDESAGLCDVEVPEHGKAGGDTAGGGVGEQADVGDGCFIQLRESGGYLGQLHEAYYTFHHACSAGSGDDYERMAGGERAIDSAGDGLADDSAHAAADEAVFHCGEDYVVVAELPEGGEDRVVETGLFLGGDEALLVGLNVGEIERIGGAQASIYQGVTGFEQEFNAFAGADLEVMTALGANVDIGFELSLEEDASAAWALNPEALRFDTGGFAVVGYWSEGGFCAEIGVGIAVGLYFGVCSFEPRHNDSL